MTAVAIVIGAFLCRVLALREAARDTSYLEIHRGTWLLIAEAGPIAWLVLCYLVWAVS